MAERNSIGEKLRSVRDSRGLTAGQLAQRAGLKSEVIDQIESGALVPSLAPLIKLARALGVRLGTFMDDQEKVGPILVHAGEQRKVMRVSDKDRPGLSDLDFYSLAADKAGRHMEPFLIDIKPSSALDAKPSAHEGEEFIYVFSGDVEISYGTEVYRLSAGDCIYYDSIVAHNVHCTGNRPAQVLAVVYAPS